MRFRLYSHRYFMVKTTFKGAVKVAIFAMWLLQRKLPELAYYYFKIASEELLRRGSYFIRFVYLSEVEDEDYPRLFNIADTLE